MKPSPRGRLADAIESIRRKLLDLSLRNPLLAFSRRRRRVQVIGELPDQLYRQLVNGDAMDLTAVPHVRRSAPDESEDGDSEPGDLFGRPESGRPRARQSRRPNVPVEEAARRAGLDPTIDLPLHSAEDSDDPRHVDRLIQTLHYPEDLERAATGLFKDANLLVEETGANFLQLALGFLEWREVEDGSPRLAPLILLPVMLERRRGQGRGFHFTLRVADDDASANISLQEKLKQQFGVTLPDFDEDAGPADYFTAVRRAISSQKGWAVRGQVVLCLLEFAKILMYKDLDPAKWPKGRSVTDHHIVRRLFNEEPSSGSSTSGFAPEYDLTEGETEISEPHLILDADSSQHSALLDAMQGKNVVIEGPPGTGKSQTIANLIGAALGAGKRVLFMAEKRAALEVVHNRLVSSGLGPFLLELHSDRVQKKAVAKHLASRLLMQPPTDHGLSRAWKRGFLARSQGAQEQVRHDLLEQRARLTAYARLVGSPLGALGINLHDALWEVARLRRKVAEAADDLERIQVPSATDLTSADWHLGKRRLGEYGTLRQKAMTQPLKEGTRPWQGVNASVETVDLPMLRSSLLELGRLADGVIEGLEAVNELTGTEVAVTPAAYSDLADALSTLPESPVPAMPKLFAALSTTELTPTIERFADELTKLQKAAAEVASGWPDAFGTDGSTADLEARLREAGTYVETTCTIDALEARATVWEEAGAVLDKAERELQALSDAIPSLQTPTVRHLTFVPALLRPLAGLDIAASNKRLSGLKAPEAAALLANHEGTINRLRLEQDRLSQTFALDLAPSVRDVRAAAIVVAGARWWERLGRRYRAARGLHRGLVKGGRPKHDQAAADLRTLYQHLDAVSRLDAADGLEAVAGPFRKGLETPCADLRALANWWQALEAAAIQWPESASELTDLWGTSDSWFGALTAKAANDALGSLCSQALAALGPLGQFMPDNISIGLADSDRGNDAIAAVANHCRAGARILRECAKAANGAHIPASATIDRVTNLLARVAELKARAARLRRDQTFQRLIAPDDNPLEVSVQSIVETMHLAERLRAAARRYPEFEKLLPWLWTTNLPVQVSAIRTWVQEFDPVQHALIDAERGLLTSLAARPADWYGDGLTDRDRAYSRRWRRANFAAAHQEDLPIWIAYLRAERRMAECKGGNSVAAVAERFASLDGHLGEAYSLAILAAAVRAALRGHPAIDGVTGDVLDEIRRRFVDADKDLLKANRDLVAELLAARPVPEGNDVGPVATHTDLALLRRESEKSKRHVPLRQLTARAGRALQSLCPCWMMSPLSVARFCDPRHLDFDVLIMDEASQLRPEDAIGAIARSAQVVIVGDRQQLPPTSFFQVLADDDAVDVDEEEDLAKGVREAESILEVASTILRPPRMLRWHYRSRHESLIAFSNQRFYDGRLVVFPSPRSTSDLGVYFEFVTNAVCHNSVNHAEATRVAELVAAHCRTHPQQSLGIVTMNAHQRDLIADLIDQSAQDDPFVAAFLEHHSNQLDKLIIKNLENIQGDERDVIIVSVTYGPDEHGNVYQRFGPVTGSYGARRLNVLFTRARDRIVVVSSMRSSHVRVGESSSLGVRTLRDYLEYAETGRVTEALVTGRSPESPFEIEVAQALRGQGFEVDNQIGVAGYFVDLAVRHPRQVGRFVLGIECDGATYHSSKSARDRDRLRQQHLEAMGWNLYRIWSTDWFGRPRAELRRLVSAVESAIERAGP